VIPRPTPANVTLRRLLVELSAVPEWRERAEAGLLDLAALLSAMAAPPVPGMPLTVVRFIATARQLADAVERGAVSEGNLAQARNLAAKGADVAQAVETWTDGGRVTPPLPQPRGTT
jgi:hypothetical protein